MLIELNKIIVKERIRKDYGDIKELAQDIKENGLINPPVVTPDNELIAGERRLRAMELLGYQQVEVRVMKVNDYIHQLNLEISENENRKEFTRAERFEYTQKLIELKRLSGVNLHQAEEEAAAESGIGSRKQFYKEKTIVESADAETLEQWDKGDISTHAAYQQLMKERDKALRDLEAAGKVIEEQAARADKAVSDARASDRVLRKIETDYSALQDTLAKERARQAELQQQLSDAQSAGNDDEAATLREQLAEANKDLTTSADRIDELEAQLKAKPIETTATVERIPEDVQRELEQLRKQSPAAVRFRAHFDALVNGFQKLLEDLAEMQGLDHDKYRNAVSGLIGKMNERL